MKKIVFALYMTLLFSLMAFNAPAHGLQESHRTSIVKQSVNRGISVREARKLKRQNRRVIQLKRRSQADGVITPREARTVRHANRTLKRNVRRERRDFNRH